MLHAYTVCSTKRSLRKIPVRKTAIMVSTVTLATLLVFFAVSRISAHQREFYIVSNNNSSISANLQVDCNVQQCYTLENIVKDPDQFFTSNRVLTLLPGYHSVTSGVGNILIADADNLIINGSQNSTIECTGTFGLTLLNVTNVQLLNIHIYHCGAPVAPEVEQKLSKFVSYFSFRDSFYEPTFIALQIVHSYNISISGITVNYSIETGLVAVNVFENFIVSQATFTHNKVNCLIVSVRSLQVPLRLAQHHNILNSSFTFGNTMNIWSFVKLAAGLSMIYAQETFQVNASVRNMTAHSNKAIRGNLMLVFEGCSHQVTSVQIEGLNSSSTYASKYEYGLYFTVGVISGGTKCTKLGTSPLVVQNSFFTRNCVFLCSFHPIISIILQEITIQETSCTGGAIDVHAPGMHSLELKNIKLNKNSGIISAVNANIKTYGHSIFSENRGEIYFENSNATFSGTTSFINNRAERAVVLAYQSTVIFKGSTLFGNNIAGMCGGIYAYKSTLYMQGNVLFMGNEGNNGGAMALYNSVIDFTRKGFNQIIQFIKNTARHSGGAIYIDDAGKLDRLARVLLCSFQIRAGLPHRYYLEFINNSASFAGSALYGGWIDICRMHDKNLYDDIDVTYFHICGNPKDLSVVSSNPSRVCICNNSLPDCNVTVLNVTVYPGQTFTIQAVTVGQRYGTVPSMVQAEIASAEGNTSAVGELEYFQGVNKVCSDLRYTVKSAHSRERIRLKVDKSFIPNLHPTDPWLLQFSQLYINVALNPCSLGFMFNTEQNVCTCHKTLLKHKIDCDINSQKVNRTAQKWINATFTHTTGGQPGILVHSHCPFDYCKPEAVPLNLEHPDKQCAFNRSGVLCGACQPQLSQVFGTSGCRECSSLWLLVLVPSIALVGVALVIAITLINLTVSVGTINGLIFYANIVRAIHTTYFPTEATNSFLNWFIAWINLDLGIDACFYNGLDAYTKTWLQFVFPLYIWVMVIIIIVSSHYSTIASKLSGRNAVQVLATLFLLSYSKMLRITITAFSSTVLVYPDNSIRRVWLYDGTVDYLKGKHIPLFITALLLLLFISLPYTTTLICIQQLQLRSKYRILSWIHKLKPLFDAYTGPYKEKHRYWTGLLLLVRVELFLVFSMNALGDPAINLLAVSVTIMCLLTYLTFLGGIYKRVILDMIEFSFYLNLGVLSVATLYTRHTDGDQDKVVCTSVSIAFISFLIIIFCQAFVKMLSISKQKSKFYTKLQELKASSKSYWNKICHKQRQTNRPHVTHTIVELREPLLEC